LTTHYSRHPDIRLTALEGEGVVLHLGARKYFTVSETGLSILEALKTPKPFDEIVTAITDEYDISAEAARESVKEFVDQCVTAALLQVRES
jgi:uncharacterized protein YbbC (DUF1343 family)